MFERTLRMLKNGTRTYSMEVPVDEEGYIDKECPNPECQRQFKVDAEDWSKLFSDEAVYCPFCHFSAPSDQWFTTEQVERLKKYALEAFEADLGQAMAADARAFNRSQPRHSFIKMSMSVTGFPHFPAKVPAKTLDIMTQKLCCNKCGAHYSVVGAAFYCPCCGDNPIQQAFINNLRKIKDKLNNLDIIRSSIPDKDEAARICDSLLESSVIEIVTSLVVLSEGVYDQLPGKEDYRRNLFQNLDGADERWHRINPQAGYDKWLTEDERAELMVCFQRRHSLDHQGGVVDREYIRKTSDPNYSEGQRFIIKPHEVARYVEIAEKAGTGMLGLLQPEQDG